MRCERGQRLAAAVSPLGWLDEIRQRERLRKEGGRERPGEPCQRLRLLLAVVDLAHGGERVLPDLVLRRLLEAGGDPTVRLGAVLRVLDRGGEAPRLVNAAELGEAGQQDREGAVAVAPLVVDTPK
jgi:hypothetical protein